MTTSEDESVVHVIFEVAGAPQQTVEITAQVGDALVDLADEHEAPVPFSCRSASCGICMVRVVEGASLLAPARADEREVLREQGGMGRDRLTCQATIRAPGRIRLRAGTDGGV